MSSASDSQDRADPPLGPDETLDSEPATATVATVAMEPGDVQRVGADKLLATGDRVGRYLVVDHIGSGGMGAVYRAFDPDLNRQVALKILRMRAFPSLDEEANRARLLREAQALAQVSHPNVISVHDVGVYDGRVFIAMELVSGQSLRAWLRETERPRDAILRVFLQAGDGLAAAHASGLVHRDFKPDNVLVGDDGRVRVIDFGLARAADAPADAPANDLISDDGAGGLSTTSSMSTPGILNESMTRTGTMLGTPRYMAPEQFLREAPGAEADQFSFCVAAYEALCRRRPFAGKRFDDLRLNVLTGKIRPPRAEAGVPAHVVRTLTRGLAVAPEARHASMTALLAELRRDPWTWWRRGALAAAAAVLVFVVAAGAFRSGAAVSVCGDASDHVVGVWDPPTRRAVERRFATSPHARAEETWARVAPTLDGFAAEWQAMHEDSCQATRVRGDQSELLFDRRARCLRNRLQQVDGFVDLLASELDQELMNQSITAARELATLDECADDEDLLAEVPLPDDPAVRVRVEASLGEVARAGMLEKAGRYQQSRELLQEIEADARDLDYAPLRAALTYKLAMLTERSGDAAAAEPMYFEAVSLAARAHDEFLAAQAWNEILWVIGYRLGRYQEALKLAPAADFAIALADDDPRARARHESYEGVLLYGVGKYEESLAAFERAVARWETLGDAHLHDLANELNNLGVALVANDREDDAIATYERSKKLLEEKLGAGHPLVKLPIFNLADARSARGEFAEALALHREALAMNIDLLGPEHPDVAHSHSNIGGVYLAMEDYPRAIDSLSQALALWLKVLGPDSVPSSLTLEALGRAHSGLGQYDRADEFLRDSRRIIEDNLGKEHPHLIGVRSALGSNEFRRGNLAAARSHRAAARALAVATHGDDHHTVAAIDVMLARCDTLGGRPRPAVERASGARDALVAYADQHPSPVSRATAAWARFVVAEARWAAGQDRPAALDAARAAAAALERSSSRERFKTVTAWIAKRSP